ncbi:hypothetical protein [Tepidibacillus fermentans]|uniref:Uncharacterized protein n=1 Tax=Tepidibacillus fermentans TaxID=1281767 RepID=A0A4R3KK45_9BACI|nr:hypothetical protein [Tepidibacillus fermentans]TCS84171.1 hypothetical protein EDD72_102215 [Tepidibacillus fermentans]
MNNISNGQKSPVELEPLPLIHFNEIKAWLHVSPTGYYDDEEDLPDFRMKDNLFESLE